MSQKIRDDQTEKIHDMSFIVTTENKGFRNKFPTEREPRFNNLERLLFFIQLVFSQEPIVQWLSNWFSSFFIFCIDNIKKKMWYDCQ